MLDSSVRGGHSPCALAATSFYAAEMVVSEGEARKRLFTQRDVANCVNVAEYTVREQFCELFRPRWDEIYDELRPMLSRQNRPRPSQSLLSLPRLQARRA
jgi:transcription initiation factor TFIIIB Brf1 subunit/transcription initiation factor TFIIB